MRARHRVAATMGLASCLGAGVAGGWTLGGTIPVRPAASPMLQASPMVQAPPAIQQEAGASAPVVPPDTAPAPVIEAALPVPPPAVPQAAPPARVAHRPRPDPARSQRVRAPDRDDGRAYDNRAYQPLPYEAPYEPRRAATYADPWGRTYPTGPYIGTFTTDANGNRVFRYGN